MQGFEVVPSEMAATARAAGEAADSLDTRLAAVRVAVANLLGGSWRGAAADGFARGWEDWATAAAGSVECLRTMAGLLRMTAAEYAAAEAASVMSR